MEIMKAYELCKWAVAFKIDGRNYDDRQERTNVVAIFCYPHQAQDFIDKCIPADTKERFFIINTDDLA
jgi:hypothetical protein